MAETGRCRRSGGFGQALHVAGMALKGSDHRPDIAKAGIDHQNSRLTHDQPQPAADPQLAQVSDQRLN